MSKNKQNQPTNTSRREFLEIAGKAAAIAPAAGLLLAAGTKSAQAQVADPYSTTPPVTNL